MTTLLEGSGEYITKTIRNICAYCYIDITRFLPVCGFIQNTFRYSLVVDTVSQAMYSIEYALYVVITLDIA